MNTDIRAFISSGGGVRIGASFGAELAGEAAGVFDLRMFNYFAGTSAGALDAALSANGWTAEQKKNLFLQTNFAKFFTPALVPFSVRELLAVQWPISLAKLQAFYDSLCGVNPFGPPLLFTSDLFINSVDKVDNVQVVFCRKVPSWVASYRDDKGFTVSHGGRIRWLTNISLAEALVRSSALPGLVADDPRYKDGGIAENPLLSIFPAYANLMVIQLGYPGQTNPNGFIKELMYCYDFKSYTASACMFAQFPNIRVVEPKVYDVSSAAFDLSREEKAAMVERGFHNTRAQWERWKTR